MEWINDGNRVLFYAPVATGFASCDLALFRAYFACLCQIALDSYWTVTFFILIIALTWRNKQQIHGLVFFRHNDYMNQLQFILS